MDQASQRIASALQPLTAGPAVVEGGFLCNAAMLALAAQPTAGPRARLLAAVPDDDVTTTTTTATTTAASAAAAGNAATPARPCAKVHRRWWRRRGRGARYLRTKINDMFVHISVVSAGVSLARLHGCVAISNRDDLLAAAWI